MIEVPTYMVFAKSVSLLVFSITVSDQLPSLPSTQKKKNEKYLDNGNDNDNKKILEL